MSNYKLFFTCKDGKVIKIKDELNRIVQYRYDGDYLTEVIHVDRGITRYTYNEEGYVSSITDQNVQTYTKNFFDSKGRVVKQDFPNGDNCIITYDDGEREVTFKYLKYSQILAVYLINVMISTRDSRLVRMDLIMHNLF